MQLSAVLLQQGQVAELPSRCGCRLFPRHSLRHKSVCEQLQMFLDLVIELAVRLGPAQKTAYLRREGTQTRFSS